MGTRKMYGNIPGLNKGLDDPYSTYPHGVQRDYANIKKCRRDAQ